MFDLPSRLLTASGKYGLLRIPDDCRAFFVRRTVFGLRCEANPYHGSLFCFLSQLIIEGSLISSGVLLNLYLIYCIVLELFSSDPGSFLHTCPRLLSDPLFSIASLILQSFICSFAEPIPVSIPSIFYITC